MNNLFEEYGGHIKSVFEAIEELAIACMISGMQPPKTMVFDKESLEKLTFQFRSKENAKVELEEDRRSRINFINTSAGKINIEEQKDIK